MNKKYATIVGLIFVLVMIACAPAIPSPTLTSPPTITNQILAPTIPPTSTATPLPTDPASTPEPTDLPTATSLPTATPIMAEPQNVIVVVVDSWRADHVSSYGYERATTPNLDQLVTQNGVRFEYAIASAPWTCPSNASLMSGKMPGVLGATYENINNTLPRRETTLAEHLRKAGFVTAGFVNNSCVSGKIGFSQGFDFYEDSFVKRSGIHTSNKVRAQEVNAVVVQWLERNWVNAKGGKPRVFLYIYYMEPHVYHDPPQPYDTLFDATYTGPITPEGFGLGEQLLTGQLVLSKRDVENKIALYDGEIAFWDAQFSVLTNYMTEIGLLDDSLLIITGDHGELLGEYGLWNHGNGLYEELLQVPLIMMYPDAIPAGLSVASPVQNMDLMPTILDWVGLPIPTDLQAVSIRSLAQGQKLQTERPVFSEITGVKDPNHWAYWQAPHEDLYSIYQDTWKLVVHSENQSLDELYKLNANSPYQGENLITQESSRVQALRELLLQWFGK